tara:strand:- start:1232 stop:1714 length:483 start_codon:yes stop_codon:yes gene_type:complete
MDTNDVNLDYIFEARPLKAIFLTFDALLISSVFLLVGFSASTFINQRLTNELDRTQKKIEVFFQILAEGLTTIIFVMLALYMVPRLPSLVPNVTQGHLMQRVKAKDFLLTFAIVACQTKFQDKIRFLLNDDDDADEIVNEEVRADFRACPNNDAGFVCAP